MRAGSGLIELHIERLVLDGVERADQDALVAALESELVRLLTHETPIGALGNSRALARLDVRGVGLAMAPREVGGVTPAAIGEGAAASLHKGLTR